MLSVNCDCFVEHPAVPLLVSVNVLLLMILCKVQTCRRKIIVNLIKCGEIKAL